MSVPQREICTKWICIGSGVFTHGQGVGEPHLNLNGIRRKEPVLAIIYDGGCVRMLLSV